MKRAQTRAEEYSLDLQELRRLHRWPSASSAKVFPDANLSNPSPFGYDVRRIVKASDQWYSVH